MTVSILDHYEALRPRLVAWFAARGRGLELAEDLTQQAFLKSWLAETRGKTIEPSYVWRVAHNLLVDHLRRSSRELPLPDWLDPVDPGQQDRVERTAEPLLASMTWLTDRQRAVLELTAQGYTQREIAAALDSTIDAVKKVKGRAVLAARERLAA